MTIAPSKMTITEARAMLTGGHMTPIEYVDALLDEWSNWPDLGAFTDTDPQTLRKQAQAVDVNRGPLAGIPLVLKANIATRSLATCAGTPALGGFRSAHDAPVAERLANAGSLLAAKGNMHELAFGITSNNAYSGVVRNPWNQQCIPGGSSGGVAAAVAAGLLPGGIGTDTGASVRLPAALCGLVGFRPTVGRYPGGGIAPISHTRDTAGPITRSVEDAILVDKVMAGNTIQTPQVTLDGIRIGVPKAYFFEDLHPDVAMESNRVLDILSNHGVDLIEVDIPDLAELNAAVGFPVALYEVMQDLPKWLADQGTGVSLEEVIAQIASPDVKGILESQLGPEKMPEAVYRDAMERARPNLQRAYADYFRNHGLCAVLFPTAPLPATPIGDDETVELNGKQVPTFPTFIRNTDPASNAGIPGISVPTGLCQNGLPIGMELDGPIGTDCDLLALAVAVEAVVGFKSAPKP